jgi:hypothetical protein
VKVLVSPSAVVLERAGPVAAVRRAWGLIEGGWWRTFGLVVLVGIINAIITTAVSVPFSVASVIVQSVGATDGGTTFTTSSIAISQAITSVGGVVAGTISYPFVAAAYVLLYIDRRMRREGLDLQLAQAATEA